MSNTLTSVSMATSADHHLPLNTDENRTALSVAYAEAGDGTMTPAMCGFWLQAIALDPNTELFAQTQKVARCLYATFQENGLQMHYAMAAAMRIKASQPRLFRSLASK